ncbi:unnamed protein product, partial [Hapterophycus canaliculatus]
MHQKESTNETPKFCFSCIFLIGSCSIWHSNYPPSCQNGGLLRELETRFGGRICHQDTINAVSYSPDGRRLASASSDGTIKLWDPSAGKQVHRLFP